MKGYFITATGTGVGKTFATVALLQGAKASGLNVAGFKPVISGWNSGYADDTGQLMQEQKLTQDDISPWRFKAALSPHRAAALEGKSIDFDKLVNWSKEQLAPGRITFMEGVGGVMVPLTNEHTVLDWMKALNWPVILVTGTYLGTISHTLTAKYALEQAGLKIATLIINETLDSEVSLSETQEGLKPFIKNIGLCIAQPRVASPAQAKQIQALAGALA